MSKLVDGVCLGEIADINPDTLPGNTPSSYPFRYVDLSSADGGNIRWNMVEWTKFIEAPSRARRMTAACDTLFGTVRPYLRSHGFIPEVERGPIIASTGFSVIRARKGVTDPSYLFHSIMGGSVFAQANRAAIGSSYPAVTERDVAKFTIYCPPVDHQSKIAEILDTLDAAIRGTEAVVAKLKAMKQGLLHDLLTRGIDANGDLRPLQSEAPHLYKRTPLGWLPKTWEASTLGQIVDRYGGTLQTGPFGAQLHAHEYVSDGIPVIMPQDLINGTVSVEKIARITEKKAVTLSRHRVQPNDIVFSRRGDLSRCAAIVSEKGWLCGTGCLLARFSPKRLNGAWFSLNYDRPHIQSQVLGMAVGSTMPNLNTGILSRILTVLPSTQEQDAIVRLMTASQRKLSEEQRILEKLRLEKSGLMDELLTGRKPVSDLL